MTRSTQLIKELGLEPHPEGGHFREMFRSRKAVVRDGEERDAMTTIYYLLEQGQHSRWHVVRSDEAWHFYEGEPLELLTFEPSDGASQLTLLGRLDDGAQPVHVVPAGTWQAARPAGSFSLAGCTVGPGFDFADFAFVSDLGEDPDPSGHLPAAYRDLL